MKKFRIKLSDGRVFGPFTKEQVLSLFDKAKVDDTAMCQTFPIGEWMPITSFDDFSLDNPIKQDDSEGVEDDKTKATRIITKKDIPEIAKLTPQTEQIDDTVLADFGDKSNEEDETVNFEIEEGSQRFEGIIEEPGEEIEDEDELEKTRVIRSNPDADLDQTVIRDLNVEFAEGQLDEEENEEKLEIEEKVEEIKEIVVSEDDATVMFDMKSHDENLPMLQKRKLEFEYKDLEDEIKRDERKLEAKNTSEYEEELDEDDSSDGKKKKSMFVIIFCVFLIFYLDDDDKKVEVKKILKPNIAFPLEIQNSPDQSLEFFNKGVSEYQKGDYYSKVRASTFFFKSLQFGFRENPALSHLVLVYGEILPMTKDVQSSARVQYKLINLTKSKLYTDWRVALGAALFYFHMDKKLTAKKILENYSRLSKNNARILSFYLKILIDEGNEDDASAVFESLSQAKKSVEVIDALASFHVMKDNKDLAYKLYRENYTYYKNSMDYLVNYGELLLDMGKMEALKKVAKALVALRGEGSPRLFGKGLKFAGFVNAAEGNIEKASKLFISSLGQYEDDELKDTLASLDLGGGDVSEQLIKYSKIEQLITDSKELAKQGKWDSAFLKAIDAVDLEPKSKRAKIYLSELQSKRGYIKEAIETLQTLNELYPKDQEVSHSYLMALIRGYQFKDVNEYLSALNAENPLKNSHLFYEILAEYFLNKGNKKVAISRYRDALKLNPIEDKYFYKLAEISCDLNLYKQCRSYLNEARSLDPVNMKYKMLYATVLFELEGIDVAKGYLLRELEEVKEDPRIIGKLAILHYQNQSYKDYRLYKEKLEDLKTKDESLYNYLIETSLIDGNNDLLIDSAERLLLINPGDIKTKMTLARGYAKDGNNLKALDQINSVIDQMPTYPKIYYEKAVIKLKQGKLDEAIEAAKKEAEISKSEFGYYILGKALIEKEEYEKARKSFELANSKNPDFFENLLELGWLKYRERDFATARELYLRAAKINPSSALLAKRLGDVFKEIGQGSLAVEQYQKYLRLSPGANDRRLIESMIKQLQ